MSLEKEFARYLFLHKLTLVKAKIKQYYLDLEADKPQIPDFMRKGYTPEDLANADIQNLLSLNDGGEKFNRLYEKAYDELKEVLI